MEIGHGVAFLAAIFVRLGGKLIIVGIFVAIEAGGELHLVNGLFTGGNVAFGAFHGDVLALE
jgi:hypothetical protein